MRKLILIFFLQIGFYFSYSQQLTDGEYMIKVNRTGKYLAIEGANTQNGAKAIQWDMEAKSHFLFEIKHLGNNLYSIKSKHSGRYLSSSGDNPQQGSQVIQWDWLGQDNQKWLITPDEKGSKGYKVRLYKNYLRLSMQYWNTATKTPENGSEFRLSADEVTSEMILDFKKNEANNGELYKNPKIQIKTTIPVSATKILTDVPDGIYKIRINETGKYLAIAGQEDHHNGMRLIQWDMLPRNNHLFKVTRLDNGNYTISAVHSEKVLDVVDKKTEDGTPVQQWDYLKGNNQEWKFFKTGKESELSIISVSSGKILQLAGSSNATDNGHQLVIKQNTGQTFHLIPVRPHKFVEYITLRDVFFTVPKLGKDQEMCGEIKVHVINKFGQSRGSYYVTPNNILFNRKENNAYDISKTGILKIPGDFKFKITSEELVGSKIVITYGINENDASVFTTFGSENNGIHGDITWVPDMTPEVFGGADDFYLLKNSFNDCLKSKLEPGKFSNNQSFFITNIPSFCQVHVNMQDEDGSDNWFDIHFTLTKERRL